MSDWLKRRTEAEQRRGTEIQQRHMRREQLDKWLTQGVVKCPGVGLYRVGDVDFVIEEYAWPEFPSETFIASIFLAIECLNVKSPHEIMHDFHLADPIRYSGVRRR